MMGKQNQLLKRYMPGLDGLRAISVLAVIAYHFNLKGAKGGLLGVEVFFVLSGYLITDQLLWEWKTQRTISLLRFWIRRIRRLLPAMVSMLLVVAIGLILIDPSRMQTLRGDFLSSVFYVNNWYLIFHRVSYFESFGPPSPIGHLWSLSIEEQFYVIWPLLLSMLIRYLRRRGKLVVFVLSLAAVSAIVMVLLYVPGTDPSRVYYGTDTRAFAILIGAALAVVWPSWKLTDQISSMARSLLDLFGAAGMVILLIMMNQTNEYDPSLYPDGFLFLSVVTVVIIAVLVHPASRLGSILAVKPLSWIGKRSYSLYIWHYPVIILSSPAANAGEPKFADIFLQLTLIFMLSALSYRFVEEPIRRGHLWTHLRLTKSRGSIKLLIVLGLIMSAFFVTLFWKCSITQSQSKPALPDTAVQTNPSDEMPIMPDDQSNAVSNELSNEGEEVTAIGDSLLLNAKPFLEKMLPGIIIDGKVGRQMSAAKEVVEKLRQEGKLKKKVIIELGTNGAFNKSTLRSLVNSLQGTEQIFLVTTRVPKNWQDPVNDVLKEISGEFKNITIIDWYSASESRANLFYKDGVHLRPEGAKYYASLLVEAVR